MTRRRTASADDSLDLLLDTICNTFGGVVFIAILVVILLQLSGGTERRSNASVERISLAKIEQLEDTLAGLSQEIERLQAASSAQDTAIDQFASEAHRNLIRTRNDLDGSKEDREQWLVELAEKIKRLEATIDKTMRELRQAEKDVADATAELKNAEKKLEEDRAKRTREARLPVLRDAPFKTELGLIVRFGRLYVWHKIGASGNRLGLNTDEFTVVGEEDGALVTAPRPTAGVPLAQADTKLHVQQRLQEFRPSRFYATLVVYPDSFAEFERLRDGLIELGFEYRLMITKEGEPIADRGGSGGKVQ